MFTEPEKIYNINVLKIEIYVIHLAILLCIALGIGFGTLVRQELVGTIKGGCISRTALTLAEIPMNIKKIIERRIVEFRIEDRFPILTDFNGAQNTE